MLTDLRGNLYYASGLPFLRQPKQTQCAEAGGEEREYG